jgi:hypothetical protein
MVAIKTVAFSLFAASALATSAPPSLGNGSGNGSGNEGAGSGNGNGINNCRSDQKQVCCNSEGLLGLLGCALNNVGLVGIGQGNCSGSKTYCCNNSNNQNGLVNVDLLSCSPLNVLS